MKNRLIPFLLTLAVVCAEPCVALMPITDNFETVELELDNWFPSRSGKGRFIQSDGRLNFVVKGVPTEDDYAVAHSTSWPDMDEDWEMIMDVTNFAKHPENSQTGCGVIIYSESFRSNYVSVNFLGRAGVDTRVYRHNIAIPSEALSLPSGNPTGGLRISYRKKNQVMTFYTSMKSRKEGYEWFKIGTFAISGSKKADVRGLWGLGTNYGLFGFELFGFGDSQQVAPGQISIDNFRIRSRIEAETTEGGV